MTIAKKVINAITKQPGLTERELAEVLFGPNAPQQRINQDCRLLVAKRLIVRQGKGGHGDPFTYKLGDNPNA